MVSIEERILEANLVSAVVKRGASMRDAVRVLQDHWSLPTLDALTKKKDDEGGTTPGDHGIPEIGRQELAFYNSLTAGQKDAYKSIKTMVETLFDKNKGWADFDPWKVGEPIDQWKADAFQRLASNPLQAFMVGQMLASEALHSVIARPLAPTDRRAIEFLEHYTFNEIDNSFNDLKSNIRQALISGMEQGENPREVARAIANTLDDHNTDWGMIAITETARADAQGRLRELADAGIEYAVGSSAHDPRTCDFCRENIDGKVVRIADTIGLSNYGRKKTDWLPVIPAHPRCRCVWLPASDEVVAMLREARKNGG